jgi:hypothetical protein
MGKINKVYKIKRDDMEVYRIEYKNGKVMQIREGYWDFDRIMKQIKKQNVKLEDKTESFNNLGEKIKNVWNNVTGWVEDKWNNTETEM